MLAACSKGVPVENAEAAVSRFHTEFNQKRYAQIYADSSEEMKGATTEEALTGLLVQVQNKLGRYESSNRTGWRVNYGTAASTQLVLETKFAKGSATETFLITGTDGAPQIAGYHINSDALFTP